MKKFMKAIAAIMLMTAVLFAAGCKPEDEPNNGGGNGTYNGHEYVDLGLPSGTLWATCNVGSDTPEGYGNYYAWGETTPKSIYDWSTYKFCNGGEGWNPLFTKYCNDSDYGFGGFTDNLTVLQPTDDAAAANWGSGWCMPTYEQWAELYENTTHSCTTQNGVNGRLFTATNGSSLFLPAAGYRWTDQLCADGSQGFYWSSSLDTDCPSGAMLLCFESEYCTVSADGRQGGFSVRPVRSAR